MRTILIAYGNAIAQAMSIALFTFIFCSTANAQWRYSGQDSAMGGHGRHLVFTEHRYRTEHGFYLRCDEDEVVAMYVLPYSYDPEQEPYPGVELLVRIDDDEVKSFAGEFEPTPDTPSDGSQVRIATTASANLLIGIRDAQRRVVAAIGRYGKIYEEHSFPVRGSTRAMEQFIEKCPTARRMMGDS